MMVRHVETLCDLGFDAALRLQSADKAPGWLEHHAPIEIRVPFGADDVLVLAEDAPTPIKQFASEQTRVVIFCQNQFNFGMVTPAAVDTYPPGRFPTFLAPGELCARSIKRVYPSAEVAVVPCFADERVFRPGPKRDAIAYVPRKRAHEGRLIRSLFPRYHPRHAELPWLELQGATENEVARTFAVSSLFLSLSRFESVGMTPLEAMASGCVVAGFKGVGGRDFATPDNGFWVEDDDCEAAADALAEAADLVRTGGPALARYHEAARETARQWSFVAFRARLGEVWDTVAPGARTQSARRAS